MSANMTPFRKMHGLGNDFVVLDARGAALPITPRRAAAIADRRLGVGCDQVIILEPAAEGADVFMRIRNPDGSEAGACGNATRCVAALVAEALGRDALVVRTIAGDLPVERRPGDLWCADMGPARLDWRDVPLARAMDTLHLPLAAPGAAPELRWEAHRARLQVGPEPVSAYRLETRLLDYPVIFYVSTLGEILRVELPGNLVATLDGWNNL